MKKLMEMMNNKEVSVRVRTATGRIQTSKRVTRNTQILKSIGVDMQETGYYNMAIGCWQNFEIVEYKVGDNWVQPAQEEKEERPRMSYEEAVQIIANVLDAQVQKISKREENGPRYYISYFNGDVQFLNTGFEVVAKAKRIKEVCEVMGA